MQDWCRQEIGPLSGYYYLRSDNDLHEAICLSLNMRLNPWQMIIGDFLKPCSSALSKILIAMS